MDCSYPFIADNPKYEGFEAIYPGCYGGNVLVAWEYAKHHQIAKWAPRPKWTSADANKDDDWINKRMGYYEGKYPDMSNVQWKIHLLNPIKQKKKY